jgi:magnesium-protoporphyrin IX monomethyl ester (oxidative) cyclase
MLELIPKIRRLNPPLAPWRLRIERFSPYFKSPLSYGMTNVRPADPYKVVFPEEPPVTSLAYLYEADYDSACRRDPSLVRRLADAVGDWRKSWFASPSKARPSLFLTAIGMDDFILLDTRNHRETEQTRLLNRDQAELVLLGPTDYNSESIDWAVDADLLVEVDDRFVPLATADLQTWAFLQSRDNNDRALPIQKRKYA